MSKFEILTGHLLTESEIIPKNVKTESITQKDIE